MKWTDPEIQILEPILQKLYEALKPLDGGNFLMLCSAGGEMVFRLAEKMRSGHLTGVEVSPELVKKASRIAEEHHFRPELEFKETGRKKLAFDDDTFDGLVSEFIIFPTPAPTEMGQPEMARVLKSGGRMVITDVIVTHPVAEDQRGELLKIGLDYLCEGTAKDFHSWMEDAGLVDVKVEDLTAFVRPLWENRRRIDPEPSHRKGYELLLDESPLQLGQGMFYICVKGRKRSN